MNNIDKEIRGKSITYIGTAFGLVAGLAWNEAITGMIDAFFPSGDNTVIAKFIYAIILTVVVVIVVKQLEKFAGS